MSPADVPGAVAGLPSHAAMEQAATWFARLQSGDATAAEQARWRQWLEADADARAAWAFVERISQQYQQQFCALQTGPGGRLAAEAYQTARHRMARRRALRSLALLAGAGAMGWGLWQHTELPRQWAAWRADHRTAMGETREVALDDGSRLWLNTASAVDQDYRPALRRLALLAGEMMVETAPGDADPRPLVVDTVFGRLQALGTRFTARLEAQGALLAVYGGAVRVLPHEGGGASTTVQAGQQVRFDACGVGTPTAADPAREAWRRGILLADGIPLSELVAELQRYRRGHLSLAPEVAGLRVLGSFPAQDTDAALAMLQEVLPIAVHQHLPWWTRITPLAKG